MEWTCGMKFKLMNFNHLYTKMDQEDLGKLELENVVRMVLGEEELVCLINEPNVINLVKMHCHATQNPNALKRKVIFKILV